MNEQTKSNLPQAAQSAKIIVQDSSEFSALLDTGKFEQLWRIATIFSNSQLVPAHFQGKKENCFLGLQMAFRLGVDPMMLLQNTFIIGGRPGMESKMIIALINSSGLFEDPLEYEIEGDDPSKPDYRVRAYATRKGTGKVCKGPWIDWKMVKAENWDSKSGSKWKSIPSQMFCYRAASFFGRLYCPERLLGMQTLDELQDITPVAAEPYGQVTAENIVSRFTDPEPVNPQTGEIPITPEEKTEAAQTAPLPNMDDIDDDWPSPPGEAVKPCTECGEVGGHAMSCPNAEPQEGE